MSIQFFATCLVDAVHPEVGAATAALLDRLGVAVEFPAGQTCCGQPGYNAGYRPEARQVARYFLDVFEPTAGPIVTPSGSCAAMVHHGFVDLFSAELENLARAKAVAERTYELSQFLVHLMGVTNVGAYFDGKLTYHPSCHLLRGLGEREAPLQLLQHVGGAEVVALPGAEDCCGFGGLFSIKMSPVSAAMVARKTANIAETGAAACVICDVGCLMNVNGRLAREGQMAECLHLAEVLANQEG